MKRPLRVKRVENVHLIERYKRFRDAGMSYGEIIKLLGKSKRQFQRWNDYISRGILRATLDKTTIHKSNV